MCTVNYDTRSNVPIFRLASGLTKYRVMSVIYKHSNLSTEGKKYVCNAEKQTMSEEDEIMINENFKDIFNDKTVPARHNKSHNLLTEDNILQAKDGVSELL